MLYIYPKGWGFYLFYFYFGGFGGCMRSVECPSSYYTLCFVLMLILTDGTFRSVRVADVFAEEVRVGGLHHRPASRSGERHVHIHRETCCWRQVRIGRYLRTLGRHDRRADEERKLAWDWLVIFIRPGKPGCSSSAWWKIGCLLVRYDDLNKVGYTSCTHALCAK